MSDLFPRLDPRARLLIVVMATVIVASTAPGALRPFGAYFALAVTLIFLSRASILYLISRCLVASPFILMAAGLLVVQAGGRPEALRPALSVALKGYSAALLLAFLTATTELSELLWALRRLGAPESLNGILGMMYRYTGLLSEEYGRMERARDCRTVRPLGRRRIGVYGRQFGTLILRSWDRAERIHAAMLSRGFDGSWPSRAQRRFGACDWAFMAAAIAAYLAARLLL